MSQQMRRRQHGFTLIELLIVVAIIGIIAAILIPNLIDALQKAKQKRTMADMRTVGTAFMSYVTDAASAAAAGSSNSTYEFGLLPNTGQGAAITGLEAILRPSATFFYLNEIPVVDGWKGEYDYHWADDVLAAKVFEVCSDGRDQGGSCHGTYTIGPFVPTQYDQNIIWADGFFVRWPGGLTN